MRRVVALATFLLVGCKGTDPRGESVPVAGNPAATPVASSATTDSTKSTPSASAEPFPLSDSQINALINPKAATEYTGPTGVVEGVVFVEGESAIRTFKLPSECGDAARIHGPLFRKGPHGELADALVAAIEVSGYVRPKRDDRNVQIKGCSIEPRALDLNLGQRLLVENLDAISHMPVAGRRVAVQRLLLPGSKPAPLFLTEPGIYQMTWLTGAMVGGDTPGLLVYVLPNALHTISDIAGVYRLTGLPIGHARITASHPGLQEVASDVTVKAGEVIRVNLTLKAIGGPAAPASAVASSSTSASARPNPLR